jgi:hypothetical protein
LLAAASFAVDCGSRRSISGSDNSLYQIDDAVLGPASYYVTEPPAWGVSNVGRFMDASNGSYIIYSSRQFQNTLDSELFQTARMSPSSLRYYGVGLENGNYTVTLQFAEFDFEDSQTWKSVGRRVFDIYVQVDSIVLITYTFVCSLMKWSGFFLSFFWCRASARSKTLILGRQQVGNLTLLSRRRILFLSLETSLRFTSSGLAKALVASLLKATMDQQSQL